MKRKAFYILVLLVFSSCYNEEVKLFEMAFEEEVSIEYYIFIQDFDCAEGIPFPIQAKSSYHQKMTLSFVKRENEPLIEIYDNGYFFLYGNIVSEDDKYYFLDIPSQDIFFNGKNFKIEGYANECEGKSIQATVNKETKGVVISFSFFDDLEGQNVKVKYLARLR